MSIILGALSKHFSCKDGSAPIEKIGLHAYICNQLLILLMNRVDQQTVVVMVNY